MAPQLKLTYFDLPARAESTRLALLIGEVPFEDDRIAFADWPARRGEMALKAVPVLHIDNGAKQLCQQKAIVRYVGHLTGLYPRDDAWHAALVDETTETVADLSLACSKAARFAGPAGAEKTAAGEKAGRAAIPRYWGALDKRVASLGFDGPFVLGEQVSIADLVITVTYNLFVSLKYYDGVEVALFEPYTKLKAIRDAVMALPAVKAHYEKYPLEKYAA